MKNNDLPQNQITPYSLAAADKIRLQFEPGTVTNHDLIKSMDDFIIDFPDLWREDFEKAMLQQGFELQLFGDSYYYLLLNRAAPFADLPPRFQD